MSNTQQRRINREKIDKLFGINKNNIPSINTNKNLSSNNKTKSSSTANQLITSSSNSKKKDIKLSDLNSNTIANINNLGSKQFNTNNLNTTIVNDVKNTTKEKTQQIKQNIQEKTQTIKKQSKRAVNKLLGREVIENNNKISKKKLKEKKESSSIFKIIISTIIILGVIFAGFYYSTNIMINKQKGMYLLENTKDSKSSLIISQNKEQVNNKIIQKSFNKEGGMEFTYSFWIVINNMDLVNKGKWKHVFHKGERNIIVNGEPNQNGIMTPGIFVHPNTNSIRIYMNAPTIDPPNLLEYVDITNIPLKKWVNITFTFTEQKNTINPNNNDKLYNCIDVYINGLLKTRKQLSVLPTLNEGDLWINNFGGYDGFISKLKYYNSAIGVEEVQSLIKDCPSDKSCGIDSDCPPYLNNKWWFN